MWYKTLFAAIAVIACLMLQSCGKAAEQGPAVSGTQPAASPPATVEQAPEEATPSPPGEVQTPQAGGLFSGWQLRTKGKDPEPSPGLHHESEQYPAVTEVTRILYYPSTSIIRDTRTYKFEYLDNPDETHTTKITGPNKFLSESIFDDSGRLLKVSMKDVSADVITVFAITYSDKEGWERVINEIIQSGTKISTGIVATTPLWKYVYAYIQPKGTQANPHYDVKVSPYDKNTQNFGEPSKFLSLPYKAITLDDIQFMIPQEYSESVIMMLPAHQEIPFKNIFLDYDLQTGAIDKYGYNFIDNTGKVYPDKTHNRVGTISDKDKDGNVNQLVIAAGDSSANLNKVMGSKWENQTPGCIRGVELV
ncbi:MAG: hypothetical protein WC690_06790, partial [bacterium]